MAIELSFSLDDVEMTDDQLTAAEDGALNPEKVYFQYLCSTVGGGHDPDAEPDEHVRDSHRALHGTIWRIDDPQAPVPPIGFGCRCGMRYVGAPGSEAAIILGAQADSAPTSLPAAFGDWLTDHVPGWEKIAKEAAGAAAADRLGVVYAALKAADVAGNLREIARMIVSAAGIR